MKGRKKQSKNGKNHCHLEQNTEVANLLALAVAQLDSSITEGSDSVELLTRSFTKMVTELDHLFEQLQQDDANNRSLLTTGDALRDSINSAVIAFQFYDRLTQRIAHVSDSLRQLNNLLPNTTINEDLNKWHTFKNTIRSSYTMEAERQMFDHIMAGHSIDEGIKKYEQTQRMDDSTNDDVEFF